MKKVSFSDSFQLTKAAIEKRKTQFRVAVSPRELDKIEKFQEDYYDMTLDYLKGEELVSHYFFCEKLGRLPYKVGETVAIAQSYQETWLANPSAYHNPYLLKALPGWRNTSRVQAILMPHQICITNIRTERLQSISDEDCLKEGIRKVVNENGIDVQYYAGEGDNACCFEKPQEAFAYLMNKVSKKDIWRMNPFMFVYDFEVVK